MINRVLLERYHCAESLAEFDLNSQLSDDAGFFGFGQNLVCFGSSAEGFRRDRPGQPLCDISTAVRLRGDRVGLPFDPNEVVENLRLERYAQDHNLNGNQPLFKKVLRNAYYSLRPLLPVSVRRHLQKAYLRGWADRPFPRWPVDLSVENILEHNLKLAMQTNGQTMIPFIWYWPNGYTACSLMTHDVETEAGRDFCSTLLDLNDSVQIKASFQVVPEKRYQVSEGYLHSIRERGCEVAVQDLNHDGHLYSNRGEFLRRAKQIQEYKKQFQATGFRSAILYRNLDWLQELGFSYDMSVPNVAHLDPQSGGCCTVFPYFIGDTLELPVTTTQDYSLFHIMGKYDLDLWRTQAELVLEKHGLLQFIIHPDYIIDGKPKDTYRQLLAYLAHLRDEKNVWMTLPNEVDRWWRARNQMRLLPRGDSWGIEGPESERACVAFACLENGQISYRI